MKKHLQTLLIFLCVWLWATNTQAQTPVNIGGWQPNGTVHAVESDANYIYLGGEFTRFAKSGVSGMIGNRGTEFSMTGTGDPIAGFPIVNNTINCVAPDGAGGWYIGGNFTSVGGVTRNRLAHINPDKSLDLTWDPNANGLVAVLIVSGTDIYIGGNFTTVGGFTRNRIAKLNTTTGAVATWNPNANSFVLSIVVSGTDVYVGGGFTNVGGLARNYIAKLSATTGTADATWNPNAGGWVRAIVLSGTDIYVGGEFFTMGGLGRNSLAKLVSTGAVDAAWNPNANGSVQTLLLSGTDLYVGGSFTTIGGQSRNRLAKVSTTGAGATNVTWNPNVSQFIVSQLALAGTDLYVVGGFTSVGGLPRGSVAKVSTAGAGAVDATWAPDVNTNAYAIATTGTQLYIGGSFSLIGGTACSRLARINKSTLELDLTWTPSPNNRVSALKVVGTELFVGGSFTSISGTARNYIAKYNTSTGTIDATWNPNASGEVRTFAVSGTDLYVGGNFNTIGGQTRIGIARLSTATGLVDTWNTSCNSANIRQIMVSGTNVYVGGGFSAIGGQARNSVAKLSTTTGLADVTWNPSANNAVLSLAIAGTDVYAGGAFNNIGGQAKFALAKLSAAGTADLTFTTTPNTNNVTQLLVAGNDIYACGPFGAMGGLTRNLIAKMSLTGTVSTWNVNLVNAGNMINAVNAFHVSAEGEMYIGGNFGMAGTYEMPNFVVLRPEINLQGNSQDIAYGSLTPSLTNHTDFGTASPLTRTYTIQNTGGMPLTISSIGNSNATDFTVGGITFPATIAANSSTTFTVTFSTTIEGTKIATITVNSNDRDESAYSFAIQGTKPVPEINLQGNSNTIADGANAPSLTDHTEFPTAVTGVNMVRTFTIQNTGTASLNVTSIGNSNTTDFTVGGITLPATIAVGASTTFTLTLNAATTGTKNATITLNNNDSNEAAYDFAVRGLVATYTTIANGNWNSAATWLAGAIPNGTNSVVIAHTVDMNVSYATGAYTLTIQNNKSLNIKNGSTLTISNGATVTNSGVLIGNVGSSLVNNGTLNNNGILHCWESMSNTATLANAGIINNIKTFNNTVTGTLNNQGIVNNNTNGTLSNNGSFDNLLGVFNNNSGATLAGAGVYAGNLVNDGTFSPGNSPGVFTINGTFTNNGTLRIEVGGNDGAGAPAGHDKLQINGDAVLGGTVQIVVINGFTPLDMNTYNFVNVSGSITNAFGSTNAPAGWIIDYLGVNVNTTFVQALPVTLISLAGKRLNANEVLISWATATETNNQGFEVEMSDDNRTFRKMGFVSGKGNARAITNYELGIANSKSAYYRLKQMDFDGKIEYSHSVFVAGEEKMTANFSVYPNPSKGLVYWQMPNKTHEFARYSVFNALGQEVASGDIATELTTLDLSAQAAGMYLLKVVSNGAVQTKQISINR